MRLFVPLTRDEFDRLREMARAERRRPQEQAAVILTSALATHLTAPPPMITIPGEAMQAGAQESPGPLTDLRR